MKRTTRICCLIALIGVIFLMSVHISPAWAQGFKTFNRRNHPEIAWRQAETSHFKIIYPNRLAGIENKAAAIAEASYEALSYNLQVSFDRKIRIYLSDEDEISNGFALPIGSGVTNIWVNVNDYAETWTGSVKWMRKVIAHELAHIFHYRATHTRIGVLQYLASSPTPRFWTEGLAQYETEKWDAQRGDRWLRMAVFDDQLSYHNPHALDNGRLLYAIGNSQVRYFANTYGDSTLATMLDQRQSRIGLLPVHDFYDSFRKVAGRSYSDFTDQWQKDMNIYYNTIASHLAHPDSLEAILPHAPGRYFIDLHFSPDRKRYAVLSVPRPELPIRRLYVVKPGPREESWTKPLAEGSINKGLSWSPDGQRLAYSRKARGQHGSLLNDIYLVNVDSGKKERLTRNRRASYPAFSPAGKKVAYVAMDKGTANIYVTDLRTHEERQITHYTGDVQIIGLRWHRDRNQLAFAVFSSAGKRKIAICNADGSKLHYLPIQDYDNRNPIWSPSGNRIAFTSLRDDVPNIFVYNFQDQTTHRASRQFIGAEAFDWVPADSSYGEHLIVNASEDRNRDYLFALNPERKVQPVACQLPPKYSEWTLHRPPQTIPDREAADSSLVTQQTNYNSLANTSHILTLAMPYYLGPQSWGLVGTTNWMEPLGKHFFSLTAGISIPSTPKNAFWNATYINNQLYPSVALSAYKFPSTAKIYGRDLLLEELTGGELDISWPLDWFDMPYEDSSLLARLRYIYVKPLHEGNFTDLPDNLSSPQKGYQTDLRLQLTVRRLQPYRFNAINPLDGSGIRIRLDGAADVLGARTSYFRPDVSAFTILPLPGLQRVMLYGRAQIQFGQSLVQDYVGFSRYDNVQVPLPSLYMGPLTFGDVERVRGYRSYVIGKQVLFGSAEYRVPITRNLDTRLLGLVSFGTTSLAAFADGGIVWNVQNITSSLTERRFGLGVELKNLLKFGPFELVHSFGIAQPYNHLFGSGKYNLYYRIRSSIPF